ncbi:MAG TPA: pyruvate:ferredoxin (flavodoxin) oxidoreductase, partial [Rikenellaceae bacterium]|nr:pyruvate:ferredoxin (flavodoxin) oxidoreductase [Rikenellaceae bacterium]
MSEKKFVTLDGNEAAAYVAYRTNEVISIYPITPSSPMGEWSDAWSSEKIKNIWGTIPSVAEMQSEGGAAGALHGALQTGALSTTFTASQGLLLMIPNMFKIAGELTANVIHVTARTIAAHALSIFGDHSDVMATRSTGYALLASASVQEAMDFALVSQRATLESRIPFLHFFDGFRTSHEVAKIELLSDEVLRQMIDDNKVAEHRRRALSPDRPVLRGTAQNPDVWFQARETVNPYYAACADITQKAFDKFYELTGRKYSLFEYYGASDAERIIVLMGSGCDTATEAVEYMQNSGEKVGVLKVRLYRPFDVKRFMEAIPASVKSMAILDRTKEAGSAGEPLYVDCINALYEGIKAGYGKIKNMPEVIGGRYGLSSKEFTPAMIKGVFDEMKKSKPMNHFMVGIEDDVTNNSIAYDHNYSTESKDVTRALFYGLGSDGTVGANKNSIKIIGENTNNYAQGYFVYDSKKAGTITISHLRFGKKQIKSAYLVSKANFIACHQTVFIEKYDMLKNLTEGGTFLLNTPYGKDEVWKNLPVEVQKQLIDKKAKFYVIDAYAVAEKTGMGMMINTIMQTCFFAISGVLPREEAIGEIKKAIKKTYGKKGEEVVNKNIAAVDQTLANLQEVAIPKTTEGNIHKPKVISDAAPKFVKEVLGQIIAGNGDDVSVGKFSPDGTFPTGTSQWEKRNIALQIPVWDKETCIQCGKCSIVCPHAVIRMKVYDPALLKNAPATFKSCEAKNKAWEGKKFTIQVAPEDCTGCGACVNICPA